MGVTYYPKNKAIKEFDTNIAAQQMLGQFAQDLEVKKLLSTSKIFGQPNIRYHMGKKDAYACGVFIEKILTNPFLAFTPLYLRYNEFFQGTEEEMKLYFLDFANFLKKCEGYEGI